MSKKLLLGLLLIMSSVVLSQEVRMDGVSHLILKKYDIYPAYEARANHLKVKYIAQFSPLEIRYSSHTESIKSLEESGNKVFSIDDVAKYSVQQLRDSLQGREWLIKVLNNNHQVFYQTIEMMTPKQWLGRIYQYDSQNSELSVIRRFVYPMAFVELPNQTICVQSVVGNSQYLIPLKQGITTGFYNGYAGDATEVWDIFDIEKYHLSKEKRYYQSNYGLETFYKIQKQEDNGKFLLVDYANRPCLSDSYDEIILTNYYILTRKGNSYDLYNMRPLQGN